MLNKKKKKNLFEQDIAIGGVSLTQRAMFAEHVSLMLSSGLTIVEALDIAHESAKGKLKKVIGQIQQSVESGHSFSESLAAHQKIFSGLFINAVRAGEAAGTLEQNLGHIAKQLEKDKELVSKIKGAMVYPIVILVAAFVLGMVLSFVVLPKITPLFASLEVELPFTTRMLIAFSTFVQAHGIVLFFGVVGFVLFMVWLVKQRFMRPITHWVIIHTPVVKRIARGANLARFSRTLGTLLKSGMNIDEAIAITRDTVSNFYYGRALGKVSLGVEKGSSLSDNLLQFKQLFPVMSTRMINVGEKSGRLDETLLYLARFYEVEVDNGTKTLSTAIEPLLLLIIGLVVGFLALSIISPIYNITGNIQR